MRTNYFDLLRPILLKKIYEENTKEAISLPVFSSPTYVVDGDMFYGQDNLILVERALEAPFK